MLKAYLVLQGEHFEKTHDLVELLASCGKHDPTFAALGPCVEPLTPFAVRFRYPGPSDPSVDTVISALVVVDEVKRFVASRLRQDSA